MKAIPCKLVINSSRGYIFTPQEFPSINQAYKYGRGFIGGVWFRIFDLNGKIIKTGHCNPE